MGLLSVAIWLPILAGTVLLAIGRDDNAHAVRWMALVAAIASFLVTLPLVSGFDVASAAMQFEEKLPWIERFKVFYHLGVDGISVWFVLLTAFITVVVVISAWEVISERVHQYMGAFLILSGLMVGVFCAADGLLFYVFFEATLIPMYIIIGVWGGPRRVYAAFKFFLYTLLGSLLMLVAIVYMIATAHTSNIPALTAFAQSGGFDTNVQIWLWLAFFASFAVKMPMWPVHTWLPDAHVEAPTAASVVLAAILLKMGGYGFLRFSLPMFPEASHYFTPFVFGLSVIAIVWASLVAFRQVDMKKLIAYSSVAHMGFVTMGIFSGNEQGIQGAIFQMLSHGIISGALFLCVGVVYDRMHTREIAFYGGLVHRMPVYAAVFMLFTMGNVGLPGTSGFPGEILTMVGAFQVNAWIAAAAALGVIFSAAYALTLYRKVALGNIENPKLDKIADLDAREWVQFAPLIIATLIMGLAPTYVLDFTANSAQTIIAQFAGAAQ